MDFALISYLIETRGCC